MGPLRDIAERTTAFALAVVRFCRLLPPTREAQETAEHLRRAANSVRANYRAARRARSRAEFQAKLQIAFEEADECEDCLEFLRDANIASEPSLLTEAHEVASILGSAVKTARANTARLARRR
ncbi:MAG: four helix bundle protein [Vicinamibacterales bacterium]